MLELLKDLSIIVGIPVVRSVAGWAVKALADNRVTRFELRQLGQTVIRVGLLGLMGYFGGKKGEETKHQTVQIASRIDVTNKQLQIANRNLSAIKRGFEGYMMPESAYFSESSGTERKFASNSMRGYYG